MEFVATGQCTCGEDQYGFADTPLFVHCCHCSWRQRETGSTFELNGLIERSAATITRGTPEDLNTPSASGRGQLISRCPSCRVALWSVYRGAGPMFLFVRMGTLNERDAFPPDVHIFTSTKQDWVQVPDGVKAYRGFYKRDRIWPEDSLRRREAALAN